jgi:hypothetical protein
LVTKEGQRAAFRAKQQLLLPVPWRKTNHPPHPRSSLSTCPSAGTEGWLMLGLIWYSQLCHSLSSIKNWNLFILQWSGFSFLVLSLDQLLRREIVSLSWK